jgi:hypothetical protein
MEISDAATAKPFGSEIDTQLAPVGASHALHRFMIARFEMGAESSAPWAHVLAR